MGDTHKNLHELPVRSRIRYKMLLLVYETLNGLNPKYLSLSLTYTGFGHAFIYILCHKSTLLIETHISKVRV